MPTFFFHLATPDGLVPDDRGTELPNVDAARNEAIASARAIIADSLREGGNVDGYAFTVRDHRGEQVLVYDFKNLLNGGNMDH